MYGDTNPNRKPFDASACGSSAVILVIRIRVNGVQIDAQSVATPGEWSDTKAQKWANQKPGTIESKSYPVDNGCVVTIERELIER